MLFLSFQNLDSYGVTLLAAEENFGFFVITLPTGIKLEG